MDPEQDGNVSIIPLTLNPLAWTNANKVQIAAFLNAVLLIAMGFGLDVSKEQMALIMGAVNSFFAMFGATTANYSPVARALRRHVQGRRS